MKCKVKSVCQIGQDDSISIELFAIDFCNYNCRYCINQHIYNRSGKILDFETTYEFICNLHAKTLKKINIYIIGGEPTLHKDLMSFCKKLMQHNYVSIIKIFSNFSQCLQFYVDFLNLNVIFDFSIHMHKIGNLNGVEQKLENLCQLGYSKNIDSVIFMLDDRCYDMCLNAYKHFKSKFTSLSIVCNMLCSTTSYQAKYSLQQKQMYIDECETLSNMQDNICIEFIDGKKKNEDYFYVKNNFNFNGWWCDAGKTFLFIDVDGNIYPCQNSQNRCIGKIYCPDQLILQGQLCKYNGQCSVETINRKNIFAK